MTRPTLTQQIDNLHFSDEGGELYGQLSQFSAADELGAIVIVAAAVILWKEHPEETKVDGEALLTLTEEFSDLVFYLRGFKNHGQNSPRMRLVGGTDVG